MGRLNDGYSVEYNYNKQQVRITPQPTIEIDHFTKLMQVYIDLGYKYWLPSDGSGGFIFAKEKE